VTAEDGLGERDPARDGWGHDRLDEIRQAALEAELDTGRREESLDQARDAIHIRLARMTLGWLLLVAGVAMLALPGPGWVVIGLALAVLSRDYLWAERTLRRIRHRLPQDESGDVHPRLIAFSVAMFVLATAGAVWWYLIR
jgi:uncharacterized protein (TIGR02611 family)